MSRCIWCIFLILGVSYMLDVSKQGKNYGGNCQTWPNVHRSDFLTCVITSQHQWLLSFALDWGETCSSLQGSCMFNKDWQRHQGNKKKQTETKWPELHHTQHSSTHLIQSTTPRPRSNETFTWFGNAAWPRHVNASVPAATGYWRHPCACVCVGMQEHTSSHDSRGAH